MIRVLVKREVAAPADRLWKLVGNFGDVSWMNGVTRSELEGQGVGMVRSLYVGDGPPVREQLEAHDEGARSIGYTITQGNPMPVTDYHATVAVVPDGPERSRLEWGCRFEASGVSEPEAKAAVEGMYGVLIGWVKAAAEKS